MCSTVFEMSEFFPFPSQQSLEYMAQVPLGKPWGNHYVFQGSSYRDPVKNQLDPETGLEIGGGVGMGSNFLQPAHPLLLYFDYIKY